MINRLTIGLIVFLQICQLQANVMRFFPDAVDKGSGYYDTWLGEIWTDNSSDWVCHSQHGWIYLIGDDNSSVWIWEDDMQWYWWTSSGSYPYFADDSHWYYYYPGTDSPRKFWSYELAGITYDFYYKIPSYYPSYWNSVSSVTTKNNCYNYACNERTDTFAQPGRGAGQIYSSISVSEVRAAALRDGLEAGTSQGPVPSGKTRVALVVRPGYDYHWYRQDIDGWWSHKPGQTNARNVDSSGYLISDIEAADWGVYTQFGGYFFVDSSASQGAGTENIK